MTGAWPFYLQVVAYAFVEEVRAGKIKPNASRKDIRQIYETSLLDEYEFIFRQRWIELPSDARRILTQGSGKLFPNPNLLSPADIALLERHGLYDQRKGWTLELDTPFCDWFTVHRRGLSTSAEEQQG